MAKVCEICGKRPTTGNTITRRGLAKYKGGIGLNTTGVSKRRFLPNVQKVKVRQNGRVSHIRVCTACLRSGKVTKA